MVAAAPLPVAVTSCSCQTVGDPAWPGQMSWEHMMNQPDSASGASPDDLPAHVRATSRSAEDARTEDEPPSDGRHGHTVVADSVVSKIAGIAARDVAGVHDLGGGTARAVGQLRGRLRGGRANLSQGVAVEVGEEQAAIDIDVVVEYGVSIPDLTTTIRQNVISAVERMTGLEVTEVNVTVHDVHRPEENDAGDATTREP